MPEERRIVFYGTLLFLRKVSKEADGEEGQGRRLQKGLLLAPHSDQLHRFSRVLFKILFEK